MDQHLHGRRSPCKWRICTPWHGTPSGKRTHRKVGVQRLRQYPDDAGGWPSAEDRNASRTIFRRLGGGRRVRWIFLIALIMIEVMCFAGGGILISTWITLVVNCVSQGYLCVLYSI